MPHLRRRSRSSRGQSLVEFAVILPFLMFLILGAIEFGFAFGHHLTLEYASREGARVGAALVNGGGDLGCGAGQSPNRAEVDPRIVAAAERVLTGSGSPVRLDQVSAIRIFKANSSGHAVSGTVNTWTYTPGAGPTVDGVALDFSPPVSALWPACARNNLQPADSLGVEIDYTYQVQTPFLALTGLSSMPMTDRTVMALNPTNK